MRTGPAGQPRSRSRRPGSRLTGLIWKLQPDWPGWKYFNCACDCYASRCSAPVPQGIGPDKQSHTSNARPWAPRGMARRARRCASRTRVASLLNGIRLRHPESLFGNWSRGKTCFVAAKYEQHCRWKKHLDHFTDSSRASWKLVFWLVNCVPRDFSWTTAHDCHRSTWSKKRSRDGAVFIKASSLNFHDNSPGFSVDVWNREFGNSFYSREVSTSREFNLCECTHLSAMISILVVGCRSVSIDRRNSHRWK